VGFRSCAIHDRTIWCDSTVRPSEHPEPRLCAARTPGSAASARGLNGAVLPEPDPRLCAALAADLTAAGFDAGALRAAWGDIADTAIARGLRRPAARALGDRDDPLAVLGRLFVLGMPQPAAAVDAALPRTGAAGLAQLGLAATSGATVTASAILRPQAFADDRGSGQWWIASDLDEAALGGPLPEDHVLGVGGASLTLAGLQLPTPAGRALDVGTGCGIQALRARRSVSAVVATDVSERALRFTRLNALLNRVEGISTRRGSLFEPVRSERFDRIVSNPPFVITPRAADVPAYEYRDGGMQGDDLVAAFVAEAGGHLAPGGVAQLLGNWESRDGRSGLERAQSWVEAADVPLDAWVVERESLDPLSYAELWIRDGGTLPGTPGFATLVDAWLDDFAARGVDAIGFGYVLLRRPAEGPPTLARYERVPQALDPRTVLGAHYADALAAHDRLAALDDTALAASVLVVAADVTEARHHLPGVEAPSVIELRQGGGFARTVGADPGLAALVGSCDGDLPVGALIDAIASLLEVDAAELRAELLPEVRELLFTGFLRFV
jgi:methylase of polypeptide subunit release factors